MEDLDLRSPERLHGLAVRPVYCRYLLELLAEEGVSPAAVLEGTDLEPADLEGRERRIRFAEQLRIYRNALKRSRLPGLGLRLGLRQRITDHGIFGYAIQSSADLAQAIRIVSRYQATQGPLLELALETDREVATIVLRERVPLGPIALMAREEWLASLVRQLLPLTDPPTEPLEILLDVPSECTDLYRRELGCPVRLGADRAELRLRRVALAAPLAFSDEETAAVCERRCEELLERLGAEGGVVENVRRALIGSPGRFPSLPEVAKSLGMSDRTLRRRLTETQTSFQAQVEGVRKGLALDYLQRSNLTIDEIASLLGYNETPSFYRAFRRWTGQAPGAYR